MAHDIYHIYDRIFKRIFALSNLAIINMINGLFQTNYPPSSQITYPNKEFVNRFLEDHLADIFITINGMHTYHLEAQIQKDSNIVLRVFEYGFQYAMGNRENSLYLKFPEPAVIYLSKENDIPEESIITLYFENQGQFKYRVKNFVYLDHEVQEINQRKMIILIPFQLLRLKELIQRNPQKENFLKLQQLIQDDIIDSIKANYKVGNITFDDANQLLELTAQLYDHLYKHYYEIGGYEDMKELLPGALELPMDKYRIQIDELEKTLELKDELLDKALLEIEELKKRLQELENRK